MQTGSKDVNLERSSGLLEDTEFVQLDSNIDQT